MSNRQLICFILAAIFFLRADLPARSDSSLSAAKSESSPKVDRPIRDKWALVIGISEFADKRNNLRFPAKDARDFAKYLISEAGFAPDHVKLLINEEATEKRILSELGSRWLPRVANPDDLVVIYISTHGSGAEMDIGGQNYLVAYDTDIDDLYTSGIPMSRLAQDIKQRVHCDRIVIFLDACHSGATEIGAKGLIRTGIDAEELAVGAGQMVIASSSANQISWESKSRPNSVFTAALLDALRSKEQNISLGEMFNVLKDRVQDIVLRERGVLQTPQLKSAWQGQDLILAAKPANPRPGFELEHAPLAEGLSRQADKRPIEQMPIQMPIEKRPISLSRGSEPLARSFNSVQTNKIEQVTARELAPATAAGLSAETSGRAALPASSVGAMVAVGKQTELPAPSGPGAASALPSVPRPANLLIRGVSLGRTRLGMHRTELINLLGKPTDKDNDVVFYRTGDKRFFLAVKFTGDSASEIAFNSPAFLAADGLGLGNIFTRLDEFEPVKHEPSGRYDIYTHKAGGFSVIVPPAARDGGRAVGVLHSGLNMPALDWVPVFGEAAPADTRQGTFDNKPEPQPVALSTATGKERSSAAGKYNTLVIPGLVVGKLKIGMTRQNVLDKLGHPLEERPDVFLYRAASGNQFLSVRFRADEVSDIAFTLSSFSSSDGINTANFKSSLSQFCPLPKLLDGWQIYMLKEGGLSMAVKNGKVVGWVHRMDSEPARIYWPR